VYRENKLKPDILKLQEEASTFSSSFAADLHQLLMCQPLVAVSGNTENITQNAKQKNHTTNLKTYGQGGEELVLGLKIVKSTNQ
jgi:hypothetical protein